MAMSDWKSRWDILREACHNKGATGRWAEGIDKPSTFEIAPPASEQEIVVIENEMGCRIPGSFRKVLLEFSSKVTIEWYIPDESIMPKEFRKLQAGECRWDLNSLPTLLKDYRSWLEIFADPTDSWDGHWHGKFPVLGVGDGDMVVIDLNDPDAVVFLSHDGAYTMHGWRLGRDFEDYIDRLSLLGCVGSESWALAPFVSSSSSFLEVETNFAKQWREWFGLRFTV